MTLDPKALEDLRPEIHSFKAPFRLVLCKPKIMPLKTAAYVKQQQILKKSREMEQSK
jgi:hypothetical protein